MNRTKIVCTLGPASRSPETLERLLKAGMNVVRLNFSHGTHAEHGESIEMIRSVAARLGYPVAILQDLAGPKIRIGTIPEGPVTLKAGQNYVLTSRDVVGNAEEVGLGFRDLPAQVKGGDTLLLADGALEMTVTQVHGQDIHCKVITGGELSSHKGINLPDRSLRTPILTDKDRKDLTFGLSHGVDFVALSFVRSAEDVRQVLQIMHYAGRRVPVIAKIEKHEALDHIDEIMELVDGIMIARGDLGVEIPLEQVPAVQKRLIQLCNQVGKPVITATQMLKSMVDSPRPTRAEATDVANAILDGTDAVMLSEETAVGHDPVRAVEVMARIANATEAGFPHREWRSRFERRGIGGDSPEEAVAGAACQIAEQLSSRAILTCTQSGSTAQLVARHRPRMTVYGLTPNEETFRRLTLVWGVTPVLMELEDEAGSLADAARAVVCRRQLVPPGETMVLTAGVPLQQPGTTNLIRVLHSK